MSSIDPGRVTPSGLKGRAVGSFSSRGGQGWHREGSDHRRRTEDRMLSQTPAGRFGRLTPPTVEATREAIAAQLCPWCGAGPYKVLAGHTHQAHGVNAAELRTMAGYGSDASICSEATASRQRSNLKQRPDWREMRERGTRRSMEVGTQRLATTAWQKKVAADHEGKYEEIKRLAGTGMLLRNIADAVGMHPRSVREILKRADMWSGDGRSVRFSNAEYRAEAIERLQAGNRRQQQRRAAIATARVARFVELGGTWSAVDQLAAEWGVTRKSAAGFLKQHGAHVPDGRRTNG